MSTSGIKLPEKDQYRLSSSGVLREGEVAFDADGTIIAVNPVTGERRRLEVGGILLEHSRKLLKD